MKLIVLVFSILMSLSAFASFSGSFAGKGKAIFKSGRTYDCKEIFLSLEETPLLFKLKEGGYSCGNFLNASFDPYKFKIQDGKLLYEGRIYGSISDSFLSYSIFDPEDGSTYFLSLKKEADEIQYLEKWHDGETIALTVEGIIKQISPD